MDISTAFLAADMCKDKESGRYALGGVLLHITRVETTDTSVASPGEGVESKTAYETSLAVVGTDGRRLFLHESSHRLTVEPHVWGLLRQCAAACEGEDAEEVFSQVYKRTDNIEELKLIVDMSQSISAIKKGEKYPSNSLRVLGLTAEPKTDEKGELYGYNITSISLAFTADKPMLFPVIPGRYPNYKAVIPANGVGDTSIDIDDTSLLWRLSSDGRFKESKLPKEKHVIELNGVKLDLRNMDVLSAAASCKIVCHNEGPVCFFEDDWTFAVMPLECKSAYVQFVQP